MAIYVRSLTKQEEQSLGGLLRGTDLYLYKWAKIVQLSSQGYKAPEISQRVDLSQKRVRHWIHAFNRQGLEALQRRPRSGRPKKITAELGGKFAQLLREEAPYDYGIGATNWTLAHLAHLAVSQGWIESISLEGVRSALKGAKFSYKRLKRWISSPDPEYEEKKTAAAACKQGFAGRSALAI